MRATRTFLMLLALLPMLSNRCRKEVPPRSWPCETIEQAPQAFLNYWYFPPGSWWVYRLQGDTAVTDTVRVDYHDSSYHKNSTHMRGVLPCQWYYGHSLLHSNKEFFPDSGGYDGRESIDAQYIGNKSWALSHGASCNLYPYEHFLHYPFVVGDIYAHSQRLISIDTLITPAGTFDSTLLITQQIEQQDSTLGRIKRELYLSKGVGITKVKFTGPETWELISYHINR